ncbi:MAG: LON peptidase substrate-binding domain-containing protein [Planctomycetes bacterium]|nr:LON peptidase substrate-binding domain-containing protein [Planctomycetota bacterium]
MREVFELPDLAAKPLAVFPLPDFTLFPHAIMPLHIFEPRYRQLIEDTLKLPEAERCFAMGTLMQKESKDTLGTPPVHKVAGVGRLVEYSKLPDGRYMIVLKGIGRVELKREVEGDRQYRRFEAEWMFDIAPDGGGGMQGGLAVELKALALAAVRDNSDQFRTLLGGQRDLAVLVDLVSAYLPFEIGFKLAQLSNVNVLGRAAHAISELENRMIPQLPQPIDPDAEPPVN